MSDFINYSPDNGISENKGETSESRLGELKDKGKELAGNAKEKIQHAAGTGGFQQRTATTAHVDVAAEGRERNRRSASRRRRRTAVQASYCRP